jgi:uncharacterized protein YegP (UPF0339 family)
MRNVTKMGGPVYVTYYKDRKTHWRWVVRSASNLKRLCASTEGYVKLSECERSLRTVIAGLLRIEGL